MTATQAPTPGPLSVGDRVVAIADLRQAPNGAVWIKEGEEAVIVREFGVNGCLVGVLTDEGHEGEWAKTCFRLAPTAPVEASGSEREHGPKCWGKTSFSDEMMYCYCGSTENRPQPSGETQEALDRMKMAAHVYEDDEMAADCATLEARLSARPLALGGQQGDSETLRVLLDNLVIAQTMSKDIRQKATDEARSYLYDLRHTPARAEAQDEGAAGEGFAAKPLDWRKPTKRDRDEGGRDSALWIAPGFGGEYAIQSDLQNFILWRIDDPYAFDTFPTVDAAKAYAEADWQKTIGRKLTAYPSPTPAADDDRVREEVARVEALIEDLTYAAMPTKPDVVTLCGSTASQARDDLRAILAALKSTAAKQGGEL